MKWLTKRPNLFSTLRSKSYAIRRHYDNITLYLILLYSKRILGMFLVILHEGITDVGFSFTHSPRKIIYGFSFTRFKWRNNFLAIKGLYWEFQWMRKLLAIFSNLVFVSLRSSYHRVSTAKTFSHNQSLDLNILLYEKFNVCMSHVKDWRKMRQSLMRRNKLCKNIRNSLLAGVVLKKKGCGPG